MEKVRSNDKRVDILFGRHCCDRLMWRFSGRGTFPDFSEENVEILGGNDKKKYLS